MNNAFVPAVVLALASVNCCILSSLAQDYEADLISYLKNNISNYSPLMRPLLDRGSPVYISMDTAVSQLISVDTAKQSVKLGVFIQASWPEERLVWNPAKFDGISIVNWDAANVWFPVIFVYNGIGDQQVLTAQTPAYLTSISPNRTRVTTLWRREFEFSCGFDMSRFPIDRHSCQVELFFSDQGYQNKLVLPRDNGLFKVSGLYRPSSEWNLINMTATSQRRSYNIIQGLPALPMPTYVISVEIERVSAYYFMNIITPLLLLILLQVFVFYVPTESGEKLGFGITIMLSYTVFLLLLDGILPKSSTTPAIASFIVAAMILSTISLLLTSLIMRFEFTDSSRQMPAWIRAVFVSFLGRLFLVRGAGNARVDQAPLRDSSELTMRNLDESGAESGNQAKPGEEDSVGSDWLMAAHAIERLMVALGVLATAVIIGVFVIKPYVR